MSKFVSPDQLLAKAKEQMLNGREPSSRDDWVLVMNFMAINIQREVAKSACRLLATIYSMPLTPDEVNQIVDFQLSQSGTDKP